MEETKHIAPVIDVVERDGLEVTKYTAPVIAFNDNILLPNIPNAKSHITGLHTYHSYKHDRNSCYVTAALECLYSLHGVMTQLPTFSAMNFDLNDHFLMRDNNSSRRNDVVFQKNMQSDLLNFREMLQTKNNILKIGVYRNIHDIIDVLYDNSDSWKNALKLIWKYQKRCLCNHGNWHEKIKTERDLTTIYDIGYAHRQYSIKDSELRILQKMDYCRGCKTHVEFKDLVFQCPDILTFHLSQGIRDPAHFMNMKTIETLFNEEYVLICRVFGVDPTGRHFYAAVVRDNHTYIYDDLNGMGKSVDGQFIMDGKYSLPSDYFYVKRSCLLQSM